VILPLCFERNAAAAPGVETLQPVADAEALEEALAVAPKDHG